MSMYHCPLCTSLLSVYHCVSCVHIVYYCCLCSTVLYVKRCLFTAGFCTPLFRTYHGVYVSFCGCAPLLSVYTVSCVPHCVVLLSMQHCFVRKTESVYRCFLYTILLRFSHLVYCVGHIALFTSALKKHALERSHLETEQEILRLFFFYSWECY